MKSKVNNKMTASQAFGKFFKANTTLFYLLILGVLASVFIPRFLNIGNFANIIRQSAVPMIACVMMSFILITCNVDLSAGYLVGLISCCLGIFVVTLNMPVGVAILLCMCIGLVFGVFNGLLITYCQIPSFIATLGSGLFIYGLAQLVGGSNYIKNLPDNLTNLARPEVIGIPLMFYYALIFVVLCFYLIHKSTFGRELRMIGLNRFAAAMSGIRINRDILLTYIMQGVVTAVCAILLTIRTDCSQSDMGGPNYPFEAMTAAVVGGTSLLGGKVSVINCALGAIVIKIIENCINLMNVNYYLYQAVLGIVVLLALILDSVKNKGGV